MKTVLCYGDSNTWGYDPDTGERFALDKRWPGILKNELNKGYRVIEEGLNGRTTVWDDPFHGGFKNGRDYLTPCLASHKPLDIVILFLGTNDLKTRFSLTASEITSGIEVLLKIVLNSNSGINEASPDLILVSPPLIGEVPISSRFYEEFEGAREKSLKLGRYFQNLALEYGCGFLDASKVVEASKIDGIHLDSEGHSKLGLSLADTVLEIL